MKLSTLSYRQVQQLARRVRDIFDIPCRLTQSRDALINWLIAVYPDTRSQAQHLVRRIRDVYGIPCNLSQSRDALVAFLSPISPIKLTSYRS